MSSTDDSTFRAVEELNRRTAQSHRRMTIATVAVAVVAGVASIAGLIGDLGVEGTGPYVLAASFLFTSLATFVTGSFLSRVILGRLQGAWVRDLAGRFHIARPRSHRHPDREQFTGGVEVVYAVVGEEWVRSTPLATPRPAGSTDAP